MAGRTRMVRFLAGYGDSDEAQADAERPRDRGEVARAMRARTKIHNAAFAKRAEAAARAESAGKKRGVP